MHTALLKWYEPVQMCFFVCKWSYLRTGLQFLYVHVKRAHCAIFILEVTHVSQLTALILFYTAFTFQ